MNAQEYYSWRNANNEAFYEYVEKWVAFSPKEGIIAVATSLKDLVNQVDAKGFNRNESL